MMYTLVHLSVLLVGAPSAKPIHAHRMYVTKYNGVITAATDRRSAALKLALPCPALPCLPSLINVAVAAGDCICNGSAGGPRQLTTEQTAE